MNYDSVLPGRIRASLERKPSRKPFKLIYKIAIALVLFAGLRHLNTVPERYWRNSGQAAAEIPAGEIRTINDLFGSHYQGFRYGRKFGDRSKVFEDIGMSLAPSLFRPTT